MAHALKFFPLFVCCLAALGAALPTSIVEEVKSDDITNRKVKRAQASAGALSLEASQKETGDYFNPTAIKRGVNLKTDQLPLLTEWDQQRYRQGNTVPSSLYASEDDLDDKTLAEYEKGYRYGTNKDKLDEALENAILKSELYGDPAAINQYRYYGNDDRKRRRRELKKTRLSNRFKRQVELSPEDILAILTLWENEREHSPSNNYRSWQRFEPNYESEDSESDNRNEDEWLDGPIYPHLEEHVNPISPNYYYDTKPQVYEKRGSWGGFSEYKKKRFMVAKKNDPTREIHYLNGPTRNDFYTLSELLGSQREPNVPLYQRYIL